MLGLGAYGSSSEDEGPDTHSSRLQKLKVSQYMPHNRGAQLYRTNGTLIKEIEKKVSQDLEYLDASMILS